MGWQEAHTQIGVQAYRCRWGYSETHLLSVSVPACVWDPVRMDCFPSPDSRKHTVHTPSLWVAVTKTEATQAL